MKRLKHILLVFTILLITLSFFNGILWNSGTQRELNVINKLEYLQQSSVINHPNNSWIDNPTFEGTGQPWFSNIEGDSKDVDALLNMGQANMRILGDIRTFSEISGTPQIGEWVEFNHSIRPLPLIHEINQYGLNVSHVYDEDSSGPFPNSGDQTANLAGVMWKRNISLSADMSDFVVTSASISVIVNGSGDTDLETPNDHPPFAEGGYASLFDFSRFYLQISDLNNLEPYEIAYFKTVDLGEGYAGRRDYDYASRNFLNDTNLLTVDEDVLIFSLTQVLRHDNHNFTITLGIDVDCEDNYPGYELDVWYSLLIKSFNFTFTYEKKIDQNTSVSWNQIGNAINGTNVKVTSSNLKFKYKIDQLWPTQLSPNSEIRIFVNNRQHTETIKLSSATTSFQEAKIDGFDLSNIVYPYENVSLSIQLFLADEFRLDRNITLSITDVYLEISYTEDISDGIVEPWIFTALLVIASLVIIIVGGYLYAYQKILKYPRPVRKVIKYRKSLNKSNLPNVLIIDRENLFRRAFNHEVSGSVKIYQQKSAITGLSDKLEQKRFSPRLESEHLIDRSLKMKDELDKIVEKSSGRSNKSG
jgi:hypothetical protein